VARGLQLRSPTWLFTARDLCGITKNPVAKPGFLLYNDSLMTLRTRRKIFYTLVVLFFVLGGGVVFYAQGWRLDFSTWHFEKIGGIYIRSYPQDASIYLNGKSIENQSGFLSPGTLISDLLPRTYNVSLKSTGYDNWEENASVLPSLVVQFKSAVLIPQNATPAATGTLKQFILATPTSTTIDPSDPNQKIVVGTGKISIYNIADATTTIAVRVYGKNAETKWITGNLIGILQNDGELYIYDTDAQSLRKLADDVKDFSATADGSMIAALENNSLEVFSLNDAGIYYRFNLPNTTAATHVIWYKDDTHLFVVYSNYISFLDLADNALTNFTTVADGTKPIYDAQANTLFITNLSGKIVQYDFPN
jgi:hypothetical protein